LKNEKITVSENLLYSDAQEKLKKNLERILGALGLAMNAGGLAVGSESVCMAIARKKARIVFLAENISKNSKEKLLSKLYASETKYIILPCSMEMLAKRLGKSGLTSSAALIKPGFEKIIFKYMADADTVKSKDHTTEVQ
jgi:ribosomal protein L7Ae-like RNA K-turn-binding protein